MYYIYQVEEDDDVSILRITGVTHEDAGSIRCIAFLPREDKTHWMPRQSTDGTENDGQTSAAPQYNSDSSSISCSAVLTVVSDTNLIGSDYSDRLSDQGVSECDFAISIPAGADDLCDDTMRGVCDVHEPAMILRGPQDTTALTGDRVLLKATYIGQPEPTIKWNRAVSTLNHLYAYSRNLFY